MRTFDSETGELVEEPKDESVVDDTPEPQQVVAESQTWPHVPAKDGVIYGFVDPNHGLPVQMAAMTIATWKNFLVQMQTLKSRTEVLAAENEQMRKGRHPDGPRIVLPNG